MWHIIRRLFRVPAKPATERFVIHKGYHLEIDYPQYDGRRPFRILRYLQTRNLLKKGMLLRPRPVSLRRLGLAHDADYLRSLEEPGALEPILGMDLAPPDQDRFLQFQRWMCGGTVMATRSVLKHGGVVANLGGGLHHAMRSQGSGFCVFNDVAVAVAGLREKGHDFPVLVVDLDLHDGDGTRSMFATDPTVHTYSIHNQDLGDTEAVASTSIALGTGIDDEEYLAAIRESLPRVFAEVRPGLVYYLAGSDPAVDDRLGDWNISLEGMLQRDRLVMDLARPQGTRIAPLNTVILLAGGYGPRAWRHGAAFFSWILSGHSKLDIPVEMELPVHHYRRLTRLMKHPGLMPDEKPADGSASGRTSRSAEDDWGLTEDEFTGLGPLQDQLFLGVFTRHGLELALEEYGLLDRLRRLGFQGPKVEVDLRDPLGHTMRILTSGLDPLILMELRLRVERDGGAASSMLVVEWLLIQDARSSFELSRPLLPGQEYPGLGLMRDTAAVLLVAAERLELDGLAFTPSHFHLASLARPQGIFPDPRQEACFQDLQRATRSMRLREAAEAVESQRVMDPATGDRVPYLPERMVIPISSRLKEHFASAAFRDPVAAGRRILKVDPGSDPE